ASGPDPRRSSGRATAGRDRPVLFCRGVALSARQSADWAAAARRRAAKAADLRRGVAVEGRRLSAREAGGSRTSRRARIGASRLNLDLLIFELLLYSYEHSRSAISIFRLALQGELTDALQRVRNGAGEVG